MVDEDIATLLMWIEPQHLPFLNVLQPPPKETCHGKTETADQVDAEIEPENTPAARRAR